jgi:hypothetical protein
VWSAERVVNDIVPSGSIEYCLDQSCKEKTRISSPLIYRNRYRIGLESFESLPSLYVNRQ